VKTEVQVVFWDVQHGHATYIKTPNVKHIVIDLRIGSYDGNDEKFPPRQVFPTSSPRWVFSPSVLFWVFQPLRPILVVLNLYK